MLADTSEAVCLPLWILCHRGDEFRIAGHGQELLTLTLKKVAHIVLENGCQTDALKIRQDNSSMSAPGILKLTNKRQN